MQKNWQILEPYLRTIKKKRKRKREKIRRKKKQKTTVEHEGNSDNKGSWWVRICPQGFGKDGGGWIGKNRDHPDHSIVKIG